MLCFPVWGTPAIDRSLQLYNRLYIYIYILGVSYIWEHPNSCSEFRASPLHCITVGYAVPEIFLRALTWKYRKETDDTGASDHRWYNRSFIHILQSPKSLNLESVVLTSHAVEVEGTNTVSSGFTTRCSMDLTFHWLMKKKCHLVFVWSSTMISTLCHNFQRLKIYPCSIFKSQKVRDFESIITHNVKSFWPWILNKHMYTFDWSKARLSYRMGEDHQPCPLGPGGWASISNCPIELGNFRG